METVNVERLKRAAEAYLLYLVEHGYIVKERKDE